MTATDLLNHDHEREAMGLSLARDGIWNHWSNMPPESEVFDRALALYPCLEHLKGVVDRRRHGMGMKTAEVCGLLIEAGQAEQAVEFLAFVKRSKPDEYPMVEDHLDGARDVQSFIVASFVKVMEKETPESWLASSSRRALNIMVAMVDDMFSESLIEIPKNIGLQALHKPHIAKNLYLKEDADLFVQVYNRMDEANQLNFLRDLKDVMCAAKAGDANLQLRLLSRIDGNKLGFGPIAYSTVVLSFWKDLDPLLNLLKSKGTPEQYRRLIDMATTNLNISFVHQPSQELQKRTLFPIVTGMAKLLLAARSAGVELTAKDYRESLRPIEKISDAAKRMQWVAPMGDSFATLKEDMKAAFDGHTPADLFKRPLPKELASAMSVVMDDTRWVAKAKLVDQGKIFSDDLGL